MNPTIMGPPNRKRGDYNVVPYQATHNTGGTIMGADPKTSAVNRYCRRGTPTISSSWARRVPAERPYNPTGVVGALAYWSANAITPQYLKKPGPLVHA